MSFETYVLEVIQRTSNVKSFRFFRPAQFEFKPGQYISITIDINGKKEKRFYSLSSSPTQKKFFEFTQKLTGNMFPVALDHLKKAQRDHKISEDEEYNGGIDMQELTDKYITMIDDAIKSKEKELMEI